MTLEQAIADGALWLESGFCADRWQVGSDTFGDSVSEWFCRDCGESGADPIDGCPACGLGVDEDDEDQEDAA